MKGHDPISRNRNRRNAVRLRQEDDARKMTAKSPNEYKVYEFATDDFIRIPKEDAARWDLREVPEAEQRDISFLVCNEFLAFFTSPGSEFKGESAGGCFWEYGGIMDTFLGKVLRARKAIYNFDYPDKKPVWAEMRDKYFGGRSYVHPDEMIAHLCEFNNKEIIEFLWFCSVYSERWCPGAYGIYAEEGYIGKLLVRLKDLPLSVAL